jgi:hypothetical protein
MNWMPEELWFDFWEGCEIFLFSQKSRPGLGPAQPTVYWLLETFSPAVMWLEYQTYHSPSSNAQVKNGLSYTSNVLYTLVCADTVVLYFVCKGFLDTNTTRFYTCM